MAEFTKNTLVIAGSDLGQILAVKGAKMLGEFFKLIDSLQKFTACAVILLSFSLFADVIRTEKPQVTDNSGHSAPTTHRPIRSSNPWDVKSTLRKLNQLMSELSDYFGKETPDPKRYPYESIQSLFQLMERKTTWGCIEGGEIVNLGEKVRSILKLVRDSDQKSYESSFNQEVTTLYENAKANDDIDTLLSIALEKRSLKASLLSLNLLIARAFDRQEYFPAALLSEILFKDLNDFYPNETFPWLDTARYRAAASWASLGHFDRMDSFLQGHSELTIGRETLTQETLRSRLRKRKPKVMTQIPLDELYAISRVSDLDSWSLFSEAAISGLSKDQIEDLFPTLFKLTPKEISDRQENMNDRRTVTKSCVFIDPSDTQLVNSYNGQDRPTAKVIHDSTNMTFLFQPTKSVSSFKEANQSIDTILSMLKRPENHSGPIPFDLMSPILYLLFNRQLPTPAITTVFKLRESFSNYSHDQRSKILVSLLEALNTELKFDGLFIYEAESEREMILQILRSLARADSDFTRQFIEYEPRGMLSNNFLLSKLTFLGLLRKDLAKDADIIVDHIVNIAEGTSDGEV